MFTRWQYIIVNSFDSDTAAELLNKYGKEGYRLAETTGPPYGGHRRWLIMERQITDVHPYRAAGVIPISSRIDDAKQENSQENQSCEAARNDPEDTSVGAEQGQQSNG